MRGTIRQLKNLNRSSQETHAVQIFSEHISKETQLQNKM